MNEKLVVVKNTISSEDFVAQMKKMRFAGNGGRAKGFDLEEKLAKAGVPEVVVKVMASEGFDECRIPLAVNNWVKGYSGKGTSSLWLSGGSGAGKSTAAAWAVKGIVEASGSPNLWPMVANSWLFPIWSTERGWVQAFTARGINGGLSSP